MEWTRTREDEALVEWIRADGHATVRRRRRPDGEWVVRLDRLHQAPEGRGYRRERVADATAAAELVDAWTAAGGDEDGDGEPDAGSG
jgi:hypothetical protein